MNREEWGDSEKKTVIREIEAAKNYFITWIVLSVALDNHFRAIVYIGGLQDNVALGLDQTAHCLDAATCSDRTYMVNLISSELSFFSELIIPPVPLLSHRLFPGDYLYKTAVKLLGILKIPTLPCQRND